MPVPGPSALAGCSAGQSDWVSPLRQFDLVFSVDVIHHVSDKAAFYREAARVLQPGGHACTVTDSEEIIRRREVLSGYFPETVEVELARYPRLADLEGWMAEAGLVESGHRPGRGTVRNH